MATAFQKKAFQNDAFQIDFDSEAGAGSKKKKEDLAKQEIHALRNRYKKAFEEIPKNELVRDKLTNALSDYVKTKTTLTPKNTIFAATQIDFKALYESQSNLWRVVQLLKIIEDMQEEEELLLLLLLTT